MASEGAGGEECLSFVKPGNYGPHRWRERLNPARQRIPEIRQRAVRLRHPGDRDGSWPLQVPASLVGGLDRDLRVAGWHTDDSDRST